METQQPVFKVRAIQEVPIRSPFGKIVDTERFSSQAWRRKTRLIKEIHEIRKEQERESLQKGNTQILKSLKAAEQALRKECKSIRGEPAYFYLEAVGPALGDRLYGLPPAAIQIVDRSVIDALSTPGPSDAHKPAVHKLVEDAHKGPFHVIGMEPHGNGCIMVVLPKGKVEGRPSLVGHFSRLGPSYDKVVGVLKSLGMEPTVAPSECPLTPELLDLARCYFSPVKLKPEEVSRMDNLPPYVLHIAPGLLSNTSALKEIAKEARRRLEESKGN